MKFVDVDAALCAHFNAPCDPVQWFKAWYDIEGLQIALGWDWDRMRAWNVERGTEDRNAIVDFLAERYTPNAWISRG